MVRRKLPIALAGVLMLLLTGGALIAQSRHLEMAPGRPSSVVIPYVERNNSRATATIFTNLGPSSTNLYNAAAGGYYVAGPSNSVAISEQWIALPFTPKAASHATQLQAAIGWISGTKDVVLGLYTDNAGAVGTLLAQASSTHIPTSGVCCQVVSVTIPSTALNAATQYWVVASSDDTVGADFTSVWQAANANIGGDVGQTGWFTFSSLWPAGAVKGTVP